jgi:nucleotide-binding universal stress UspA family protein
MKRLALLIDGSPNDAASLEWAVDLCRRLEAQLTVLHPHHQEVITAGAYEMAAVAIDNSAEVKRAAEAARAAFESATKGFSGARLVEVDVGAPEAVERLALYHDVVMLERLSQSEGPDVSLMNAALWGARMPVMALPPGHAADIFGTVVVAWSATAQSARALRAALPMICRAERLVVLTRTGSGAEDPELAAWLAAHGVRKETWRSYGQQGQSARAWGRSLLQHAKEEKASLLVSGAFGGTLSNFLGFDRTTEKICTGAEMPVFLHA